MPEVKFTVPINGKETEITMDSDPEWYKVEPLFDSYINGGQAKPTAFLAMCIKTFVISGINKDDMTAIKSLRGTELTKLIGEIIKRSPLPAYMENLSSLQELFKKSETLSLQT